MEADMGLGRGALLWILGVPIPVVAQRQRRSDADRLGTAVDPVKRHSLPPRLLGAVAEVVGI
jgi:hypothetical protein